MKKIFPLAIFWFCLTSQAQVQFENGYYIDNSGVKHNVLIQNTDPKNNPTLIRYKNNSNSKVRTVTIEDIQEYKVSNDYFIRSTVNLDRTKDDIKSLKTIPNPTFKRETIFLKMLVDGKADLFIYIDGTLKRYFYRIDQSNIEQLVYMKYLKEANSIASNIKFQQQLFSNLNCESLKINQFKALKYNTDSLINIFKDYNSCQNSEYQTFLDSEVKGGLNFRIKLGAGLSNLSIEKNMADKGFDFKNTIEPKVGVELEYIFPFNRNKWGFLTEISYRKSFYEESFQTSYSGLFKMEYNSFEWYGGFRHYLFLQKNSKIFVGGGVLVDFPFNSEAKILETTRYMDPELYEFESQLGGAFGLGYEFANKVSVELRYTSRKIYGENFIPTHYDLKVDAKYSSLFLILGYKIF